MITRSGAHGPPARPRYSRRYSRAPMFTVQPLFAIQPRRDPCSVLTAALAVASRVLFRKLKAKAKKTFVFISRSPVRLQNYSPQSSGVHTTASSRRRRPHKRQGAPARRSLASRVLPTIQNTRVDMSRPRNRRRRRGRQFRRPQQVPVGRASPIRNTLSAELARDAVEYACGVARARRHRRVGMRLARATGGAVGGRSKGQRDRHAAEHIGKRRAQSTCEPELGEGPRRRILDTPSHAPFPSARVAPTVDAHVLVGRIAAAARCTVRPPGACVSTRIANGECLIPPEAVGAVGHIEEECSEGEAHAHRISALAHPPSPPTTEAAPRARGRRLPPGR